MREKLKSALESINTNVVYGILTEDLKQTDEWNYIVFGQEKIVKEESSKDLKYYYSVVIVREGYIPDDLISDVIDSVEKIPGLRLANGDHSFEYSQKGNTDFSVEILELRFVRKIKRCN